MSKIQAPESFKDLPLTLVQNLVTLITGGFGFAVALAWNEVIKSAISHYIEPYFGKDSTVISLAIYALVITIFAVFITMQLTKLEKKLVDINLKLKAAKARRAAAAQKKTT